MTNGMILVLEIVVTFSLLLLAHKAFGEVGLTAWVCIASVIANLVTAKSADILGFSTAIGSVMFASTFLATDILTELYSAKSARRAVYMGLASTFVFIVATQIALAYAPSVIDYADEPMRILFTMNLRISISSMVMYFIANMGDIYLFEAIRKLTKGKYLWIRNNVATILCNCLENFLFIGFAFYGIYTMTDIVIIALSTSVIEAIVGVCDTPFLYLAVKGRNDGTKAIITGTGKPDSRTGSGAGSIQ